MIGPVNDREQIIRDWGFFVYFSDERHCFTSTWGQHRSLTVKILQTEPRTFERKLRSLPKLDCKQILAIVKMSPLSTGDSG